MPIQEISMRNVQIADDFWSPRQKLVTDVTIPYMEKILRDEVPEANKSHAISNFRMAAGEETGSFYGMVFQDSDVAKWLEAAAYSLSLKPDKALSERIDQLVALIGRCQQQDGYLNTYFTVKEPENRWKNLLECHELYCAGHMMEAAAALHEAAGKDDLLRICIRLADHICDRFEKEDGIPGHQEIEIGLLRLFHVTGNIRYRDMALRFLNLRGKDPDWFIKHTPSHPGIHYGGYDINPADTAYNQSDVPVREQTTARGHAVRQLYMLTAMADTAAETGDQAMQKACLRLFDDITQKQMYVTGAVGASAWHEAFTVDYDLPPDRCYGETCASVAMVFFAHKMLKSRPDGRFADLMELELYNAALAGMQLDGKRFFYVNPLEVDIRVSGKAPGYAHVLPQRPPWHDCACCPPNLARLIASLSGYLWGEDDDRDGYIYIQRIWKAGDTVSLSFDMSVRRLHADVRVRSCAGKTALARGPFIYCFEETDQEKQLLSLSLPLNAVVEPVHSFPGLPGDLICLSMQGIADSTPHNQYSPDQPVRTACPLKAIPYFAWANRSPGNMLVWIRENS